MELPPLKEGGAPTLPGLLLPPKRSISEKSQVEERSTHGFPRHLHSEPVFYSCRGLVNHQTTPKSTDSPPSPKSDLGDGRQRLTRMIVSKNTDPLSGKYICIKQPMQHTSKSVVVQLRQDELAEIQREAVAPPTNMKHSIAYFIRV